MIMTDAVLYFSPREHKFTLSLFKVYTIIVMKVVLSLCPWEY
jgi:hypothetical protein